MRKARRLPPSRRVFRLQPAPSPRLNSRSRLAPGQDGHARAQAAAVIPRQIGRKAAAIQEKLKCARAVPVINKG